MLSTPETVCVFVDAENNEILHETLIDVLEIHCNLRLTFSGFRSIPHIEVSN
jgi:hypothetical protein